MRSNRIGRTKSKKSEPVFVGNRFGFFFFTDEICGGYCRPFYQRTGLVLGGTLHSAVICGPGGHDIREQHAGKIAAVFGADCNIRVEQLARKLLFVHKILI